MRKKKNKPLRIILRVLAALILIAGAYAAYVFIAYHRLPDNTALQVRSAADGALETGTPQKLVSFNTGFGAYEPDYSFFMDGGTESWAWSEERLKKNLTAMTKYLKKKKPDILLLQEVDMNSTRTYHVDETETVSEALPSASSVYAVNYDSPFLFYPFGQPHGKSLSGIMTLANFKIESSVRKQLPVETSVMKIIDLDRCYCKSSLPVEDSDKLLLLYNVHLSAYTSDGTVADRQLELLAADMADEAAAGNYVICGGDFNKDLLGDSSEYFGIKGEQYSWSKPIKTEVFDGKPLRLVAASNVPSNRVADAPYNPQQFVDVLDGFIVSDNINVVSNTNLDTGFAYSDHNPVEMEFELIP